MAVEHGKAQGCMTTNDQVSAAITATTMFNTVRLAVLQLLRLGLIDGKTSDAAIQAMQDTQATILSEIKPKVDDVYWLHDFLDGVVMNGGNGPVVVGKKGN